jgi:hypothetical protein
LFSLYAFSSKSYNLAVADSRKKVKRDTMIERYSKQPTFPEIGTEVTRKLGGSHVLILGRGALGNVIANTDYRKKRLAERF